MELAGSHLVFQLAEVMVLRLLFAALLRRVDRVPSELCRRALGGPC